jgi:hypothetical protein
LAGDQWGRALALERALPRFPPEYELYTTIYNQFNCWSRQGIWLDMFKALTDSASLFGAAIIDSSLTPKLIR